MEPADNHPAASLPPGLDNPTDRLICGLLTARPLPSPEIAERLAISARTVRHRLMRLRRGGAVVVGDDGLYRLPAVATAALPAVAAPGGELVSASAMPATRGNAAVLVAVALVAVAVGCLGAAMWAARHQATAQGPAPAAPPASPAWPYAMEWPGQRGW